MLRRWRRRKWWRKLHSSETPMAIQRLRHWWRRAERDSLIRAFGATSLLLLVFFLTVGSWIRGGDVAPPPPGVGLPDPSLVDLTLVKDAQKHGAVCLDGSLPGYHFQSGSGSGSDSWVLHLEGGGWCNTVASCLARSRSPLGSSDYMDSQVFSGILSPYASENPDFYNWNRVKVRYCDGASFYGNVESEYQNGTKIYFRGMFIWRAVMDELILKGLANAKQAFLTGCSAGGLAAFLHCNDFQSLLPEVDSVKCLADGGFFLDEKDISGKSTMRSFYNEVVRLHDLTKYLDADCISRKEPCKCFFPREIIKKIHTPLFILNSAYDSWQIQNVLVPRVSDPEQHWLRCKLNIHDCDTDQINILQGFRNVLLNTLSEFQNQRNGGMFIDSCFAHCQTMSNMAWHSPRSPRINNRTIAEAVGDWYFNRRTVREIDCAYPCNPTCNDVNYSRLMPGI